MGSVFFSVTLRQHAWALGSIHNDKKKKKTKPPIFRGNNASRKQFSAWYSQSKGWNRVLCIGAVPFLRQWVWWVDSVAAELCALSYREREREERVTLTWKRYA